MGLVGDNEGAYVFMYVCMYVCEYTLQPYVYGLPSDLGRKMGKWGNVK